MSTNRQPSVSGIAFARRGLLLNPADLSYDAWPALLEHSGVNVLGLHSDYASLCRFMESAQGDRLRADLSGRRIELEHCIHFSPSFMTKSLFARHPDWFSMDVCGVRYWERANPCTSHPALLDYVREQAAECARCLPASTHRYQLLAADAQPWCHCEECSPFSPSDQNLRLMNAMLEGVRSVDPAGELACAAYMETLPAPTQVRPAPGVYLLFAPYRRNLRRPLGDPACWVNREQVRHLDDLLRVFGASPARVLDYWLDVSLFSYYRKPAREVLPPDSLLQADAALYRERGITEITTFACWMDADYLRRFGDGMVRRYGAALRSEVA